MVTRANTANPATRKGSQEYSPLLRAKMSGVEA